MISKHLPGLTIADLFDRAPRLAAVFKLINFYGIDDQAFMHTLTLGDRFYAVLGESNGMRLTRAGGNQNLLPKFSPDSLQFLGFQLVISAPGAYSWHPVGEITDLTTVTMQVKPQVPGHNVTLELVTSVYGYMTSNPDGLPLPQWLKQEGDRYAEATAEIYRIAQEATQAAQGVQDA